MNDTAEMVMGKFNPVSKLKSWLFGGPGAIVLAILATYFALFKGQAGVLQVLQSWGPSFPISLICIGVVSVYLGAQIDIQRDSAESYGAIAQSLQKIAEKDDRDKQEMQILIGVVNNKVEQTHELTRQTNRSLDETKRSLDEIKQLILNHPAESTRT